MLKKLKKEINCHILWEREEVYPYAYDTSPNSKEVLLPKFVIFPECVEDVQKIVKFANENNMVIIPRGAGTCHTGGCRVTDDTRQAIVIHFSKMNNIIKIDTENLLAIVQPNVTVGEIQRKVEEKGLFFPPDPSNLEVSTIGGAIALSSGGPKTFKYGSIKNYILSLDVVDYRGELIKTGQDIRKSVTGYNLTDLFIGSEGTLGIIVGATLKLIPKPEVRKLILAYFKTLKEAGECVNKIVTSGITPSALDLLDDKTLLTIEKFNPCGLLTRYEAALLIELDGNKSGVKRDSDRLCEILYEMNSASIVNTENPEVNENIWKARRSAFASCAKLAPNIITEDIVVPVEKITEIIKEIKLLSEKLGIMVCIMGHAADGNIHPNFALDFDNHQERDNFYKLKDELFATAIKLGGTLSGEHGIGIEKKQYLSDAISANSLHFMRKIKKLFDPNNIFNPGKSI